MYIHIVVYTCICISTYTFMYMHIYICVYVCVGGFGNTCPSGVALVGRYMPLCASAAFCSREDPSVPLGAMPSPPGVTQPPRFYHIPEGVGRLDALEFRRPYPVFDIHHVADRLNEEQTLTLTHGLVCHGLPWGICSFGAGKFGNGWTISLCDPCFKALPLLQ